jgi:hypothetical protein
MRRIALALPLIALAAGCASLSPEDRVRSRLIDAGVPPRPAACMAARMVDQLSMSQLRRLQSLSRLPGRDVRDMTVDELLYQVRGLGDPEIVAVVTRAGLGCMIAG